MSILQYERRDPLMPHLEPFLNRKLIAAQTAVSQFQDLLRTLGGPNEAARWNQLHSQITIFSKVCETISRFNFLHRRVKIIHGEATECRMWKN